VLHRVRLPLHYMVSLLLALLTALLVALGPLILPAHANGGVLSGKVTSAETGAPLVDIVVRFYTAGELNLWVGETTTLADGSYSIGISNGSFLVEFYDPTERYEGEFYSEAFLFNALPIVINSAPVPNINAQLSRAGTITGKVTGNGGAGVIGIWAGAFAFNSVTQSWRVVSQPATTEADGTYAIRGLRPGQYRVGFYDSQGVYLDEYYNNSPTPGGAQSVTVNANATTPNVNVALDPAGIIEGTITLPGGTTDTGIEVLPYRLVNGAWVAIPGGMSDEEGRYRVGGLPTGQYRLKFADPSERFTSEYYNDKATFEAADTLNIVAGTTTIANAELAAGSALSVTVTTPQGAPLPNMAVTLYRNQPPSFPVVATRSTNASGVATFVEQPSGFYRIGISDPAGNYASEFYNDKLDLNSADVVALQLNDLNLAVTLVEAGSISGRVSSEADGSSLDSAQVTLFRASDNAIIATANSDNLGNYALRGLRAGSYKLNFSRANYQAEFFQDAATLPTAQIVDVAAGSNINNISAALAPLDLPPPPVYTATLQLSREGSNSRYIVTNQGEGAALTFHRFFAAGNNAAPVLTRSFSLLPGATLEVDIATFDDLPTGFVGAVDITSNEPLSATLLEPVDPEYGAIRGSVFQERMPLIGVQVLAMGEESEGQRVIRSTVTANDGSYQIADLPPGLYTVYFFDPATGRDQFYSGATTLAESQPVEVNAGATVENIGASFAPATPPLVSLEADSGAIINDPNSGQVTVLIDTDNRSDLIVTREIACINGETLSEVKILLGEQAFLMSETSAGSGRYQAIIPANSLTEGTLRLSYRCNTQTTSNEVGRVQLYDPSGVISDQRTGNPVVGATVTLYNVPGWRARTSPDDNAANTCESNNSKPRSQRWSQPAPIDKGIVALPDAQFISPTTNVQTTGPSGGYGWDVAAGCWYVVVEAPGYNRLVSPVVGVPSAVTDLNLNLQSTNATDYRLHIPMVRRP
jgi:5-hydroxyisourate hydrolase-like protein (transthyretin family)